MKLYFVRALCVIWLGVSYGAAKATAQATADTAEAHLAVAKAAAKQDYGSLYELLCSDLGPTEARPAAGGGLITYQIGGQQRIAMAAGLEDRIFNSHGQPVVLVFGL